MKRRIIRSYPKDAVDRLRRLLFPGLAPQLRQLERNLLVVILEDRDGLGRRERHPCDERDGFREDDFCAAGTLRCLCFALVGDVAIQRHCEFTSRTLFKRAVR